ncbi:MAG: hypothetical protein R2749_12865 [Acidimicrobiales bacterium]
MDFEIPAELQDLLRDIDAFIDKEIKPLEEENDNIRFFDHRRENARTNWTRACRGPSGAAARDAQPGRQGGVPALGAAQGARWLRRLEPGHGRHPRAPGRQGPPAAQRPAERVPDRGQLPHCADGPQRGQRAPAHVVRADDHR